CYLHLLPICRPPIPTLAPYTTLFRSNTMGPLLNPAGVRRQVVGAFDKRTARQIAEILSNLDSKRVYSVHARDGLDEFSLSAPTLDRKSTRLNSSHVSISYAVFCLKKK